MHDLSLILDLMQQGTWKSASQQGTVCEPGFPRYIGTCSRSTSTTVELLIARARRALALLKEMAPRFNVTPPPPRCAQRGQAYGLYWLQ